MKKHLISVLVFSMIIIVLSALTSCEMISELDGGNGDSSDAQDIPEDVLEIADFITGIIGMAISGENPPDGPDLAEYPDGYPDGMSVSSGSDMNTLVITISDVEPDGSGGPVVNGSVTLVNSWTPGDSTSTLDVTASFSMTNWTYSSCSLDALSVFPVDSNGEWTSDEPESVSGTLTVDGTVYDFAEILDALEQSESDDGEDGDEEDTVVSVTTIDFIACGTANISFSDGTNWEAVDNPGGITGNLYGIACDAYGNCVAVGDGGKIIYSDNGRTWTAVQTGTTESLWSVVAAGSGLFIADIGNIQGTGGSYTDPSLLSSGDGGRTWSTITPLISGTAEILDPQIIWDFAWSGSRLIAVGSNYSCYSDDLGATWTVLDGPAFDMFRAKSVDYSEDRFVIAGYDQFEGTVGKILYSADGETWLESEDTFPGITFHDVFGNGNGNWVVTGEDVESAEVNTIKVYFSDENAESGWVDVSGNFESMPPSSLTHVTCKNGTWMASHPGGWHYLSLDGRNWTESKTDYYATADLTFRP